MIKMVFFRWLLAWLGAALITSAAGSIIHTQLNLARVVALDGPVSLRDRLQTTLFDLVSFAPTWFMVVAAALVIALPVAGLVSMKWSRQRVLLCALAGFVAVATALALMNALLPVTVVAGARTAVGFILLCLPGALGGWFYAWSHRSGLAELRL